MGTTNRKNRITRRGFLELGSAAFATAGLLGNVEAAKAAPDSGKKVDTSKPDSALLTRKIALEEHFALPETADATYAIGGKPWSPEFRLQIQDMGSGRIAEMDRGGVELCILSFVAPGIQGIPGISQAIAMSRRANDYLAEHIAKYPKRLKGFAALPLQDPQVAAQVFDALPQGIGLLWRAGCRILTDWGSRFGFLLRFAAISDVLGDRTAARCALLSSSPRATAHAPATFCRTPVAPGLRLGIRCGNFASRAPSHGQRPVR